MGAVGRLRALRQPPLLRPRQGGAPLDRQRAGLPEAARVLPVQPDPDLPRPRRRPRREAPARPGPDAEGEGLLPRARRRPRLVQGPGVPRADRGEPLRRHARGGQPPRRVAGGALEHPALLGAPEGRHAPGARRRLPPVRRVELDHRVGRARGLDGLLEEPLGRRGGLGRLVRRLGRDAQRDGRLDGRLRPPGPARDAERLAGQPDGGPRLALGRPGPS